MKVPSLGSMPWWAQAGLVVLAMAGTVVVEYLNHERERNALGLENNEEPQKASKRSRKDSTS